MNIVLIGMRGSGKSTIGKLLAKRLHKRLVETDRVIENKMKTTISEIVSRHGWKKFRQIEKKVVKEASGLHNTINATGGGVILSSENMNNLKMNGLIVYLKTPIEILIKRVRDDANRPLLTNAKNINEDMQRVLKERRGLYEKSADYIVETNGKTENEIVQEIIDITNKKI